jgi:hypothetical protein
VGPVAREKKLLFGRAQGEWACRGTCRRSAIVQSCATRRCGIAALAGRVILNALFNRELFDMKRSSIALATLGALALAACGGGEKAANNSAASTNVLDPLGGNVIVDDLGNSGLGNDSLGGNLSGNSLGGNTVTTTSNSTTSTNTVGNSQ